VALAEGLGCLDPLQAALPAEWLACAFPEGSWADIDWSPLAGRRPVIVPRNDSTGADRAAKLERFLRGVGIAASVLPLPPSLPPHWQVSEGLPPGISLFFESPGIAHELGSVFSAIDLAAKIFEPLHWIIRDWLPTGLAFLVGKSKIGKAQPCETVIPTPAGWSRMGDIKPGDLVFGANGRSTEVLQVHPQGICQIFDVELSDGSIVQTTSEHLWQVRLRHNQAPPGLLTTEQIAQLSCDVYLPQAPAVTYPAKTLPLDPYLLGLLLGNGGFRHDGVSFTSAEDELLGAVEELLPVPCRLGLYPHGGAGGITTPAGIANPVVHALRQWGLLNKKSTEKSIPSDYLIASLEQRFALLQGLLDTDGWVEDGYPAFSSSSQDLALGVKELVESLGGVCRLRLNPAPRYRLRSEYRFGQPSYAMRIRLPNDLGVPFRLPRKAERCRPRSKLFNRRIVAVREAGLAEAVCLTVAHPDGLYLTSHYAVTHNSWCALEFAIQVALGLPVFGKIETNQCEVLYLALEDGYRRLQERMFKLISDEQEIPPGLIFATNWPRLDNGGMERLTGYLEARPACRLIIIDVLAKVRAKPDGKSAGIYQMEYDDMAALQRFAHEHDVCILLIHHTRKADAGTDELDVISGTTAMPGAADTIMILSRKRGDLTGKLLITGRDIIEDGEYALNWNKTAARWELLGRHEDVKLESEKQKVFDVLNAAPEPVTPREIADELGMSQGNVRRLLDRLRKRGFAIRRGYGLWGFAGRDYDKKEEP